MKYHAGDQHRYKLSMDMTMNMDTGSPVAPPVPPIAVHFDSVMQHTVKSVDPTTGNATVTMQLLSMTQTMNGKAMTYPGADKQLQLAERPVDVVMSPAGKVVNFALPDAVQKQVTAALGNNFLSSLQGVTILPDKPVAVGKVWHCPLNLAAIGLNISMDMTLKSVDATKDGNVANVGLDMDTDLSSLAAALKLPATLDGSLIGDGTQSYNIDHGTLNASNLNMDANVSVKPITAAGLTPPPGMPQQMKVKWHMTMGMNLDDSDTTPVPPVPAAAASAPTSAAAG
jgi:hypothetical protein